jgi:hypothetical protein
MTYRLLYIDTGFGQKYIISLPFKSEDLFSRYFFDYRTIYDIPTQIEIMRTHTSKKKTNKQFIRMGYVRF